MQCPSCGQTTLFDPVKCKRCGHSFGAEPDGSSRLPMPTTQSGNSQESPCRFCSSCGGGLEMTANFCSRCGQAATSEQVALAGASSDPAAIECQSPASGSAPVAATSPQSILHARISGWAVLGFLFAGVLGVYGYFANDHRSATRDLLQQMLRREVSPDVAVRSVSFHDWYLFSESRKGLALVDVPQQGAFELSFTSIANSDGSHKVQTSGIELLQSGLRQAVRDVERQAVASQSPGGRSGGALGVTIEAYNKLVDGMKYEEVVKIIGSNGVEQSSTTIGEVEYKMIIWRGAVGSMESIAIQFEDGKIFSKVQFGLE